MSAATEGRYREYQTRDLLIDKGYPVIMRSAGSKGAADLLHGHPLLGAVLVQVGKEGKALGPADRIRFLEAAALTCALPLLATVIPRPGKPTEITFRVVSHDVPSKWSEWTP